MRDRNAFDAKVGCYSGLAYAERPETIQLAGGKLTVIAIEKAAREPEGKRFVVRTAENRLFDLCYNELHDTWTVRGLTPGIGPDSCA
ncbi:MAG: hypothetical protein HYY32_05665 [Chloroflexi bacterium]|nr:hypothetical protein [Chloroflexota bacterium]